MFLVLAAAMVSAEAPGASYTKPVPTPRFCDIMLCLNCFISAAYGLMGIAMPKAILAIYGHPGDLDFMDPAHGVAQYLGGLHLFVAWNCLSALGKLPFLPARDKRATLEAMFVLHALAAAVAGYRAVHGYVYISFLQATATPLPGSILMTALSWRAARRLVHVD